MYIIGGSVLNSLLVNGFVSNGQDLDFFWIGDSYASFLGDINRFERRAHSYIIQQKKYYYGKVIEFILSFGQQKEIRVQFIFGKEDCNSAYVLHTFDIDIVQVGYDGSKLISVTINC